VAVNLTVNAGGFFDGLLAFLDHCVAQGMIQAENRGLVQVARDAEEALALVEKAWRARAEVPVHDARLDEVIR
jgi:predicted Rossmann-fold nucleotide-binding protein